MAQKIIARRRIQLKIIPNASRDEIVGKMGDAIKIKLRAPACDGKANRALVEFLAAKLSCSPSQISIVCGQTSRIKIVELPLDAAEILTLKNTDIKL